MVSLKITGSLGDDKPTDDLHQLPPSLQITSGNQVLHIDEELMTSHSEHFNLWTSSICDKVDSPTFASDDVWRNFSDKKTDNMKVLKLNKSNKIAGFKVIPVSLNSETHIALRIMAGTKSIGYMPNVRNITNEAIYALSGCDVLFLDGSSFSLTRGDDEGKFGHASIKTQLTWLDKLEPKQIYLTNLSNNTIQHRAEVLEYSRSIFPNTHFATDNLSINLEDNKEFNLQNTQECIRLHSPHASLISKGMKSLIVLNELYESYLDKVVYLCSEGFCYGAIKITSAKKMDLAEFETQVKAHRISKYEYNDWLSNAEVMFAYEFEQIEMFSAPKRIFPSLTNEIFGEVQFDVKSSKIYSMQGKENGLPDNFLLNDHTQIHELWTNLNNGKKITGWDFDRVFKLHSNIVTELAKRGIYHHSRDMLDMANSNGKDIAEFSSQLTAQESKLYKGLVNLLASTINGPKVTPFKPFTPAKMREA